MALSFRVKPIWPVKSRLQLTDGQASHRVAPIGCDHRRRGQDEIAISQGRVGYCEFIIGPDAPRPQEYIEIEGSCLPRLPAPYPTEMRLNAVEAA